MLSISNSKLTSLWNEICHLSPPVELNRQLIKHKEQVASLVNAPQDVRHHIISHIFVSLFISSIFRGKHNYPSVPPYGPVITVAEKYTFPRYLISSHQIYFGICLLCHFNFCLSLFPRIISFLLRGCQLCWKDHLDVLLSFCVGKGFLSHCPNIICFFSNLLSCSAVMFL